MPVRRESYWGGVKSEMPPPGSIEHIEYLLNVDFPTDPSPTVLANFLVDRHAAPSIYSYIEQHQNPHEVLIPGWLSFDTRNITRKDENVGFMRGAVLSSHRGPSIMLVNEPLTSATEPKRHYSIELDIYPSGYLRSVFEPGIDAAIIIGEPFLFSFVGYQDNPHLSGHNLKPEQLREGQYINTHYKPRHYDPFGPSPQLRANPEPQIFIEAFRQCMQGMLDFHELYQSRQGAIDALKRALAHQHRRQEKRY